MTDFTLPVSYLLFALFHFFSYAGVSTFEFLFQAKIFPFYSSLLSVLEIIA